MKKKGYFIWGEVLGEVEAKTQERADKIADGIHTMLFNHYYQVKKSSVPIKKGEAK